MDENSNPYNEKNIKIKKTDIEQILRNYHIYHKVKHMEIWERAFVNSSYIKQPNIMYSSCPFNCLE